MRIKHILWVPCIILLPVGGLSQDVRTQVPDLRDQRQRATEQRAVDLTETTLPPMEAPIDPATYVVGPADIFTVNIWINPPMNFVLTVTPEGTLVVPTVGEVPISGLTLKDARLKVLNAVKGRYTSGEPTVTLLKPRRVVVTVRGAVERGGNLVLYSTDRVQSAIMAANPAGGFGREQYSLRNILLRRRDGTAQRVDIVRFLATREERWNPFLREGDEIIVPAFNAEKEVIGVYGGVNVPGRYEFAPGDSLSAAIELAGGLTSRGLADSVMFSRLNLAGSVKHDTIYNLADIREGRIPDPVLQPGDRIFVRERPEFRGDYRVYVRGEVMNPGTYPITRNSTYLTEVIRMAGGFTEDASLPSSKLFRKSVPPEEESFEYLKSYKAIVAPHDSSNYLLETSLRIQREIIQVDFERLFSVGDSTADILLRSEDEVVVSRATHTVYVFGQVLNPGHIPFVGGEGAEYYINAAGGYGERANESAVLVIKRVSGQAIEPGEAVVEDGDYVWVPMDADRPPGYYLGLYAQAAVILTALTSFSLLIIQITQ